MKHHLAVFAAFVTGLGMTSGAASAQTAAGSDPASIIRYAGSDVGSRDAVSDAVLAMLGRSNDDPALQEDIAAIRRDGWRSGRSMDGRGVLAILEDGHAVTTALPAAATATPPPPAQPAEPPRPTPAVAEVAPAHAEVAEPVEPAAAPPAAEEASNEDTIEVFGMSLSVGSADPAARPDRDDNDGGGGGGGSGGGWD